MKTKNFLLPAIAIAIFAAPVMALDLSNYREELSNSLSKIDVNINNNLMKEIRPFTIDEIRNRINNPERVTLDEFHKIETFAFIMEGNISDLEKYHLMVNAILNKHDDILEALITGGFNPSVDLNTGLITLPTRAVQYNDIHSFVLTFDFNEEELALKVFRELKEMDESNGNTSLIDRLNDFESQILDIINSISKKHNQTDISPELIEELNKEGYEVDKKPAATIEIKVTE